MNSSDMPATQMIDRPANEEMPSPHMQGGVGKAGASSPSAQEMPAGAMMSADAKGERSHKKFERVLIELRAATDERGLTLSRELAGLPGITLDPDFEAIPMKSTNKVATPGLLEGNARPETVIVRATVDPDRMKELESHPSVIKIWKDGPIAPFGAVADRVAKPPTRPIEKPQAHAQAFA